VVANAILRIATHMERVIYAGRTQPEINQAPKMSNHKKVAGFLAETSHF
jgi:hypothetical protein